MAAIHVDMAADAVYGAIMNLPRHADWATHDLEIEAVDNSPLAVGKTFTSSHRGNAPDQVTITELVPGERFGFDVVIANGLKVSHTITVSEESGGALVTRESRCTEAPGLKVLLRPLLALVLPMGAKKNLKSMKSQLERFGV